MSAHGGWGGDVEAVGKALDILRRLLEEEVSGHTLLHRLCEWAVDAFSGAEMAGAVLSYDAGGSGSVACAEPRVASIEDAQIRTGKGPGPVAADTCTVVRGEFGEGVVRRWPALASAVEAAGFESGSFLCAPLSVGDGLGSLNLYSRIGSAFSEFDAALLRVYATLIASTIRLARDGREAREEVAGLIKAMESRSIIEQAKGIVMATGGVSADEAFDFLVVSSQQRNIKLARLAKELVDPTSGADGVKAIARTRDYSRSRQGTSILTSSSCPDATTARLPG